MPNLLYPWVRAPGTHGIGGWVGRSVREDVVDKAATLCHQELNLGSPDCCSSGY